MPTPTVEPDRIRDLLEILERRSYKTYGARLRASNRLASRHHAWNLSVIASSTATTIAAVAILVDSDIYGRSGEAILVCVSILTLVTSLATSSLNYSARSRDMFLNYRRIQQLSAEVERAKLVPELVTMDDVVQFNARYDALLDESENHVEADYLSNRAWKSPSVRREWVASLYPYLALVPPVALLVPLAKWLTEG